MAKFDIAHTCTLVATDLVNAKKADDQAATLRESANANITVLHRAKAVIGRYNKCAGATAFVDSIVAGGLSKKTAQNYLSLFRESVKTGKPVADWGSTKDGAGRKGKGGGKGKGTASFVDLFLKAFNHDNGASFQAACEMIQAAWHDDQIETVYAGFVDFLKAEGLEIAE